MKSKNFTPFKRARFLFAAALMAIFLPVGAQTYSWVKQYHGTSRLFGREIACAPSGDNYATAEFQGTVSLGSSQFEEASSGQLLMKHDGAGTFQWVLPMKNVIISALKATETHVFLAGYYNKTGAYIATHQFDAVGENYDGFIVRITDNGVVDLVVELTAEDMYVNDVITDLDVDLLGRMYITGSAGDSAVLAGQTLNNVGREMFFARIDQDGSVGWVTTCNGEGGASISTSSHASRIFVSARVSDGAVVDFDNSAVTYSHTSDGNPNGGFFLLSCDNNGEVLDTRMLVSSRFRVGVPMLALSDYNDLYVVMNHQYDNERIMKFDTLLKPVWEFNDPDRDAGIHNIAVDISGNLLIAGAVQGEATFSGTQLSGEGNWMGFVAKYDSHGNLTWITGALNNTEEDGASIWGVDSDSHTDVYVNGMFSVPVDFPGYGTLSPAAPGFQDMFIARIRGLADYDAIAEQKTGRLHLYPTVNDGHFQIDLSQESAARCTITDVSGRCIYETAVDAGHRVLNVNSKLSDGVYFVNVYQTDGNVAQGKIVVRN